MAWAWVHGLVTVVRDERRGATRLRPMVKGDKQRGQAWCARRHKQGICIPRVGPGLGHLGWLEWASHLKRKSEGKGMWAARVSTKNNFRGKEKLFYFQNVL
jgi:hypothetical protein